MQLGLVISVLLHVAILGGALISIQSRQELRLPETEPVAVGMISPGDVTKVKQGVEKAKLLEAEAKESPKGHLARKEAPRPKLAASAPPPPAAQEEKAKRPEEPKAADPPPAAAAADAQKAAAEAEQKLAAERERLAEEKRAFEEKARAEAQAKAEALKRAEAQRLAEEQKRAEEERKLADARKRAAEEQRRLKEQRRQAELKARKDEEKRLKLERDRKEQQRKAAEAANKLEKERARLAEASKKPSLIDKIEALLNKIPDAAPPPRSAPPDEPTKAKGPTLGAAEGRDNKISAGERAMLLARISTQLRFCWKLPSGGGGSDTPAVKLRWRLNADGSLDGDPEVLQPRGDALFRLAAEAAQRAVRECAPFDLPPESYEAWRIINWNFDPSKML